MQISLSNTGKTISFTLDDEAYHRLNAVLNPQEPGRFSFSYDDGFLVIKPAGQGRINRLFRKPPGSRKYAATAFSSELPEMPTFGYEVYDGFVFNAPGGGAKLPMPRNPKPVTARNYKGTEYKRRVLDLTKKDAVPPYDPVTGRYGAKNGFAGFKSIESWQRAEAGRQRGTLSHKRSLAKKRKEKQPISYVNRQRVLPKNVQASANVTFQVGNKIVSFNVPNDELFELSYELAEKGYRVKETA